MKKISMGGGFTALVSNEDFEFLSQFTWYRDKKGYFIGRNSEMRDKRLHRVIAKRMGLDITLKQVDHIDRNLANNRRNNLRAASNGLNRANSKLNSNNKSGFKGVHLRQKGKLTPGRKRRSDYSGDRWMAQINVDGKKIFLGDFDTPEKAHEAYKAAALKHFGEFANPQQGGNVS